MVATRRGANKGVEAAPAASNTLNAPPKRGGGRKKAVVEEAAEPAPVVSKPIKTTAAKRKAKAEPEAAEPPMAKKTTTTSRTTRTAKVETKTEPAPTAPKRATRGRKVEEVAEVATAQETEVIEEAPKPTTTRARKVPAKKASVPKAAEPAVAEEPAVEEAPKLASRVRKAPVKKAPVAKKVELPVVEEEPVALEPTKPALRARKAAVPKATPAPVIASRPTRGRNAAPAPQESPLKAPARKPAKKATAPVVKSKAEPEPVEEPFTHFPDYPTTPAHIAAPLTSRRAMAELPDYPNTPAHIHAPISTKDALAVLPDYPKTPAHINAPIGVKAALAEMPGYPKTPAHIKAPMTAKEALAEMPDYPKTPAHIVAPIASKDAMKELPDYPKTPAHIKAPIVTKDALDELPGYPKTPAHIQAPVISRQSPTEVTEAYSELDVDSPEPMDIDEPLVEVSTTPVQTATPVKAITPPQSATPLHSITSVQSSTSVQSAEIVQTTPARPATPVQATPVQATTPREAATPAVETAIVASDDVQLPSNIVWGVTDQEAFEELPVAYPTTPAHITAPVTVKEALAELPDYPKTPAHITAPLTPRRALAELPSYPTTPALDLEIAIQEEISASVKKQTPSPLKFPSLEDVSFQFAENSEITEVDTTEIDSEGPEHESTPRVQLAPIAPLHFTATLPAPALASPMKSALRSPQKFDAKTPKKAVTWDDPEESELFLYDGPLQGMTFYVDITRNGKEQNYLFSGLLEDLGAKVVKDWATPGISHVLYKDGSKATLEKVVSSKGSIKCVNVGWVLDSEKNKMRMDEAPYLVDLSIAMPASPRPATTMKPFTPARTPSKYALPPSSECRSVPTTPTSSEFDRSINFDDKENQEHGIFFDCTDKMEVRTVPQKKSSFLFSRSPIKTPSKPSFLLNTPMKPQSALKPFSTTKKRSLADSTFGSLSVGPPKKLRLF